MATFYNSEGVAVSVEIEGVSDALYDVTAMQIESTDTDSYIFNNIFATQLRLSILTSSEAFYKGSLIGKSVEVEIGSVYHHYTIVSNMGNMPANTAKEVLDIEAVDDITMLKNERTEMSGYYSIGQIFYNTIGEFIIGEGFGTIAELDALRFNVSALYEDEGQTAPVTYDVLRAVLAYIHRSMYYDNTLQCYVLYNPKNSNVTVEGWKYTDEDSYELVSLSRPSFTINAQTIGASDRSISILDPIKSSQITAKFDDIDVANLQTVTYPSTGEEKTVKIGDDNWKYRTYWGDKVGALTYISDNIGTTPSLVDKSEMSWAIADSQASPLVESSYYIGGWAVKSSSGITDSTGDVSGVESPQDYILLYNTDHSIPYPLYREKFKCSTVVSSKTYLIMNVGVTFSKREFASSEADIMTKGNNTSNTKRKFRLTFNYSDGTSTVQTILKSIDVDGEMSTGRAYRLQNDVYWDSGLGSTGAIIQIPNAGKTLTSFEVEHYSGWMSSDDVVAAHIARTEWIESDYTIETASTKRSDTDTIYKYVNDMTSGVTIQGEEREEQPKYVTYDGKKGGQNCVADTSGYAGELTDVSVDIEQTKCVSEVYGVSVDGSQYGRNVFTEAITVKGLVGAERCYYDNYFTKNCAITSFTWDVAGATTNINIQEI